MHNSWFEFPEIIAKGISFSVYFSSATNFSKFSFLLSPSGAVKVRRGNAVFNSKCQFKFIQVQTLAGNQAQQTIRKRNRKKRDSNSLPLPLPLPLVPHGRKRLRFGGGLVATRSNGSRGDCGGTRQFRCGLSFPDIAQAGAHQHGEAGLEAALFGRGNVTAEFPVAVGDSYEA